MYSLLTEPSVPVLLGYTFLFSVAWQTGKAAITALVVLIENKLERSRLHRAIAAIEARNSAARAEQENAVPAPLKKTRGARV